MTEGSDSLGDLNGLNGHYYLTALLSDGSGLSGSLIVWGSDCSDCSGLSDSLGGLGGLTGLTSLKWS